ncbi:hypothetical protein IF1G_10898 [Cordyceps javanica]|uniref:Fungal hydrophobin domain-containing protein n=1 Tax=Cordyceps javanica TaxID=43265 RepID=A0A545VJP7_9HYPO|nr:hypothetical protein IF1G_10898 [Cordyceps javanica]TQW01963.1 fungal hydrophobin domain-containing protein [Cordyceps javanica]
MQFFLVGSLIAGVLAMPHNMAPGDTTICPNRVFNTPWCCHARSTAECVDGQRPYEEPRDRRHLSQLCTAGLLKPYCCAVGMDIPLACEGADAFWPQRIPPPPK